MRAGRGVFALSRYVVPVCETHLIVTAWNRHAGKTNLNTSTIQVQPCPTKKKVFASEHEAVEFEERNRERYNHVQQHAYLCEDCGNFHLSTYPPDSYQGVTTNYAKIETSHVAKEYRRVSDEEQTQMLQLFAQGVSINEIAKRLNRSYPTVWGHIKNNQSHTRSTDDVATLSAEERELEEKLERLRQKKQQLIEARRLKVATLVGGTISIRKELQILTLCREDCFELHSKLEEILTGESVEKVAGAVEMAT